MELGPTALVTTLSALLGSWAGAKVALDRYRAERTFDRQVEWYERAAGGISDCIDALEAAVFLEAESRNEEATSWWVKMPGILARLGELGSQAQLFAEEKGYRAIAGAIQQLIRIERLSKSDAKKDLIGARTVMATAMLGVLRPARVSLANDLRKRLDLKPLSYTIVTDKSAAD